MSFDFYKRAAIVCRAIPYGKVATYGQIALLCGRPKNARQVGYALNRNRLGDDIPAHRVVNARGILSGAAAFDTADMQKLLLEMRAWKSVLLRTAGRWISRRTAGTIRWKKHCAFRKYLRRRIYKG